MHKPRHPPNQKNEVVMEFRQACRDDVAGILALYTQLNPDDPPLDPEQASAIWERIERSENFRYFVAVEEGVVRSTCNLAIVPNLTRGGRSFGVIENVVTDEPHRGRGLAKSVIELALSHARAQRCYKVMLMSSSKRRDAHAFYERIGFDGTSKRGFYLALPLAEG